MNNQTQQQKIDPQVASIVKAIAYTENGGDVDINNPKSGQTGEMKSLFQFEPNTWKSYAKQVSGNENLPMNPKNEALIAYQKVGNWLQKGYTVPQIASMWNAGVGEPNAYTGKFSDGSSSQGVNQKYGVKYDVPGYAQKVEKYVKEFSKNPQQQQPAVVPTTSTQNPVKENKPTKNSKGFMGAGKKIQPSSSFGGFKGLSSVPPQSS